MKDHGDFEKLIEAAVVGDPLEPADKARLQDLIASGDEHGDKAREIERFEMALIRVLDVADFGDDVAGKVLDRVTRRSSYNTRRKFSDGLAARVVADGLERGRIDERSYARPRIHASLGTLLRVAVFAMVTWALWIWFYRDVQSFEPNVSNQAARDVGAKGKGGQKSTDGSGATTSDEPIVRSDRVLARVRYGASADLEKEPFEAIPNVRDLGIGDGDEVKTIASETAIVALGDSGRILVHPSSHVVVTRGPQMGTVRLRLRRGSLRIVTSSKKPIFLQNGPSDAEVTGDVEMTIIAPENFDCISQSPALLVRAEKRGQVAFRDRDFRVGTGEMAVIAGTSAAKLPLSGGGVSMDGTRVWGSQRVPTAIEKPLLVIGEMALSREDIMREGLRYWSTELLELIVKSSVVQIEVSAVGVPVSELTRQEAAEILREDGLFALSPLRSSEAFEDRVSVVAGLMTLARSGAGASRRVERSQWPLEIERTWRRLEASVVIEHENGDAGGLRIRHRGRTISIAPEQAWRDLQRYLRVHEVEVFLDDLVALHVVRRFMRTEGIDAPDLERQFADLDPQQRAASIVAARLNGMTWRQYRDRCQIVAVMAQHLPLREKIGIDGQLGRVSPRLAQSVFEHYFFPFTEAQQGMLPFDARAARAAAAANAEELRQTRTTGIGPRPKAAIRHGIYRSGIESGPCAWWRDLYGSEFEDVVSNLAEGQVSPVIEGPEGLHVVAVLRKTDVDADPEQTLSMRRSQLTFEAVRRLVRTLSDELTVVRPTVTDVLER